VREVERVPDTDTVQAVLDALGVTRVAKNEVQKCRGDDDCAAPGVVVYVIITDCVTINNAACEDWDFCRKDKY